MEPNPALGQFIQPYDETIQNLAMALRDFIIRIVPETNELIWDNYNAVAIAYSKSLKLKDAFCHIALYAKHVNLGFNRGAELTADGLKLEGKGKLIRHIKVKDMRSFPEEEVTKLIREAFGLSLQLNPDLKGENTKPKSIVMSISEKKGRPKREQ